MVGLKLQKKSLIGQTLIYTITDGVSRALAFITLPLISSYLLPEELGLASNFDVLRTILMLLAGEAVVNSLPFFYYKKTQEERAIFVSSLLFLILLFNVVFSGLIFIFNENLHNILKISFGLQLLTIVSVITNLIVNINLVLYRLEEKAGTFSCFQLMQTLINLLLLYFFVVQFNYGALGKIWSTVLSVFILSFFHLFFLVKRKYLTFHIRKKELKDLLNFGVPLLPHSLSFWFKSGFDKIILTMYCGLATNGLYSMAMSFGAIYLLFDTSFARSYGPYLQKRISNFNQNNQEPEKKQIVKMTYKLIILFFVLYIFCVTASYILMNLVLNEKYIPSFQFVPWIMLALTFNSIYGLVVQFVYTAKKTLGLGIITFSGSVIQLLVTFIGVKYWGVIGVKFGYVFGSFLIMIGVWLYSSKVYPMPWGGNFLLNKKNN